VRLNPVLEDLRTYPFVRLTEARRAAEAGGADVIDFGIGEPQEETPAFIRAALTAAVEAEPVSTYPLAEGLPELRAAVAGWVRRRFGADLDPDREVIPTLGSKEAVFGMAQVVCGRGDRVAVTAPGYPVPSRGARFAGCEVVELPLDPARGWLPDLDAADWSGVRLLWLNFPNNPTGATAPLALYEHAAALGREHGFVVASDEAYSELWFAGEPPASALQVADRRGVVVCNTLSKRSSMPGYRSGFVAGDPAIVAALRRYRPNVGVAPQRFVQRAAVAAWGDEAHVEAVRARYAAKRDVLLPALEAAGLALAGGEATFFLWLRAGGAAAPADDEALATRLLDEHGLVLAPGSFFGRGGAGHVRVALVPTPEACAEAARRLGSRR
jgi:acetylornithine aminotransferase